MTNPLAIRVTRSDDQQVLAVASPYHPDFPQRARALGGRWVPADRVWQFDAAAEEPVRAALRDVYGTDGAEEQLGVQAPETLYVYVPGRIEAACQPVVLAECLTLARAFGRDSGARTGAGVAHLRGPKPGSGGSTKNWCTVLPAGCLLMVHGVPAAVATRARLDDRFIVSSGDGTESPDEVLAHLATVAARDS